MQEEEKYVEEVLYEGKAYDRDYMAEGLSHFEELGLDPNDESIAIQWHTGAMDDEGISETLYTPYRIVRRRKVEVTPGPIPPGPTPPGPTPPGPTPPGPTPPGPTPPGPTEPQEEEEERYHVVRVDNSIKSRFLAWIAAGLILFGLSGFSLEQVRSDVHDNISVVRLLNYSIDELIKEYQYKNITVEEVVNFFSSKYDIQIGQGMQLDGANAYTFGDLTGECITLNGEHPVTGFCLYSPDGTVKYEYSFYEDRDLDGVGESTNVDGLNQIVNVSIDDFLAQLDAANYDLNDVRFSLHFGNSGWIDFSDIIDVNSETRQIDTQKLVEIIKKGASYEGVVEDTDVDFIKITNADGEDVWVPITDDDDNLYAPGTTVVGSDGKEYVLSNLEIETVESLDGDVAESKTRLRWDIMDCELALLVAPLVAATALAIAHKLENERNKRNPNFFEFENDEDYQDFLRDFKEAKEDYRKSSKFGRVIREAFFGRKEHIARDLTEEQIQEMYTTIRESDSETYRYSSTDRIHMEKGQVWAYHEDGTRTNITSTVAHIGKDNPGGTEGLLTDEVVEKHGGGKKS